MYEQYFFISMKFKLFSVVLGLSFFPFLLSGTESVYAQNGNCQSQGLGLTESNHCARGEIKISNRTSAIIYYDFGSKEDESLRSRRQTTWTLGRGSRNYRTVKWDSDLLKSGIQLKQRTVYAGRKYAFVRSNDRFIRLIQLSD